MIITAQENFSCILVRNMDDTADKTTDIINEGNLDAVTFGIPLLVNLYLPERIKTGASLNAPDADTFYT